MQSLLSPCLFAFSLLLFLLLLFINLFVAAVVIVDFGNRLQFFHYQAKTALRQGT